MMICVAPEPKNLDETSEMNGSHTDPISYMQSFNNVAMRHIFSYLNTKDLAVASRVCTSWNMVSKDKIFWRYVKLKDAMVYDWDKFIDMIIKNRSTALDSRGMLMPCENQDFDNLWTNFISAIKRATELRQLVLCRCPINVLYECIKALPQLSVLNASLILNPNDLIVNGIDNNVLISMGSMSGMVNLTEVRLKGEPEYKLESSTLFTFENLTKLRTLSLKCVKIFSTNLCRSLETVTTNLEHLEIGDCKSISDGLPMLIKRFTNLKMLRLENCQIMNNDFAKELFVAIRSLKKLKILELVNIVVDDCVEKELEKCTGLNSLLVIPMYIIDPVMSHRNLIECLKKLSKTLKYLVWGLTQELLYITFLFNSVLQKERHPTQYSNSTVMLSEQPEHQVDEKNNIDIMSVTGLQILLEKIMVNGNFKVITVYYSEINQVYIQEYFKEIRYV